MLCMRKHIHRGKALGLIAQLCQGGKVAGESDGVAADVDHAPRCHTCLLYTSDAADEEDSGDLGGRRIIKKKKKRANEKMNTRQ